ncbi:Muskelin, partial [Caulochytrium protostelioides]
FGKHHRPHMFNLRQFKVFASLDGQHWAEMLHTGLRNDAEPETFSLLHIAQPVAQPVRFLKIAPWLSWGANFSFSVWYVALRGTTDPAIVQRVVAQYHS